MKKPWQTLSSKIDYKHAYWQVKKDKIISLDGKKGHYYFVDLRDFVSVIAIDKDEKVFLVRQWRYPISRNSWETAQGTLKKKESPLAAAKRELMEETGIKAKNWKKIGFSFLADGMSNQGFHVFLAKDLIKGEKNLERTELDMITEKFLVKRIEEMIESGKIFDSPTITSFYCLKLFLKKI